MSFGERLKHFRLLHKLNQSELAEKLHVTAQAVSKWENNISEPEFQIIDNITELFHISYDQLFSSDSRLAYQGKIEEVFIDMRMGNIYTFFTLFLSFLLVSLTVITIYTLQLDELPNIFPISFVGMALIDLIVLVSVSTMRQVFQTSSELLFTIYTDRIELTDSKEVYIWKDINNMSIRVYPVYEDIGRLRIQTANNVKTIRNIKGISHVYEILNQLKYNNTKGE